MKPFDLLDMDWSPELWITRFDSDKQNAWLAQHVWDENALDVPEDFFSDLRGFLGLCYCPVETRVLINDLQSMKMLLYEAVVLSH